MRTTKVVDMYNQRCILNLSHPQQPGPAGQEIEMNALTGYQSASWNRIDPGLYENHIDHQSELADALLTEPQFIWDFLGDVDQGGGLDEQAVKAIVRAVMSEMKRNPALAHRYRVLAEQEARDVLKKEAELYR